MLPNFLIVGAMKAGTSSFADLLNQHPDVYIPHKELHFFSSRFENGDPPREDYERLFPDWTNERWIGEKTPTYSYQVQTPARIASWLPDVKLVWLFREPVARSYSHYQFFHTLGKEWRSFKQALAREKQGKTRDFTMRYVDRSIYVTQVERYLNYFPKEQMLFLLFEEFITQHQKTLQKTAAFFDIDPLLFSQEAPPHENKTRLPASPLVQWVNYSLFKRKGWRIRQAVTTLNRRFGPEKYPPLDPELRAELSQYFQPYNQQLAAVTGLNLSIWAK